MLTKESLQSFGNEITKEAYAPLVGAALTAGRAALPWIGRMAGKLFTRGAAKAGLRMAGQGAAFEAGGRLLSRSVGRARGAGRALRTSLY